MKWALHEMGLIPLGIRLPLLPLDPKFHDAIREALRAAGALKSNSASISEKEA